jgi:hypothetical protein
LLIPIMDEKNAHDNTHMGKRRFFSGKIAVFFPAETCIILEALAGYHGPETLKPYFTPLFIRFCIKTLCKKPIPLHKRMDWQTSNLRSLIRRAAGKMDNRVGHTHA